MDTLGLIAPRCVPGILGRFFLLPLLVAALLSLMWQSLRAASPWTQLLLLLTLGPVMLVVFTTGHFSNTETYRLTR